MRIAIGSDERSYLTKTIVEDVKRLGHNVEVFGSIANREEYWPAVAEQVASRVADGDVDEGILLCWTGTGVCIAANKVPGVRAALCEDAETVRGARLWNQANVLCLSMRRAAEAVTKEIVESWFRTECQANKEDDRCLAQLSAIEERYLR